MKKQPLAIFVVVAALVTIISCGGGGGSSAGLSRTGQMVQQMQRYSGMSMSNAGMTMPWFMLGGPSGGGGTTGSTGGVGAGGVSSIGGFVRHFGGPNGAAARAFKARRFGSIEGTSGSTGGEGTSGTDGGGGGTSGSYSYFDEWLQMWVDVAWTETSFTCLFWLDEAKTQEAGHITSSFAGSWESFPQSYTSEYAFTAGPWAGSHGTYECLQEAELTGHMSYENTYSDGSNDHGQSLWADQSSTWSSRWDGPAKSALWYEDSGTWTSEGSDYACSNSDGWSSNWHYNSDWSGYAHFEGPDPKLPADMTWTADGHYRIVYADGSVEEWTWWDCWGRGEIGTSGSTGSGGFTRRQQAS